MNGSAKLPGDLVHQPAERIRFQDQRQHNPGDCAAKVGAMAIIVFSRWE
jgi:hypothetical protein